MARRGVVERSRPDGGPGLERGVHPCEHHAAFGLGRPGRGGIGPHGERILVPRTGRHEVLEFVTEPGPGEALVRVAAAGISFGEVLLRLRAGGPPG